MLKEISRGLQGLSRQGWLGIILVFTATFFIFFWHLGNLTPGLSAQEKNYANSAHSFSSIVSDPVNAPHKLIQFGIFQLVPSHPSLLRLASVLFGLVFCLCFYFLTCSWFGRAIGIFSTLILACLPIFVLSARQVSAAIMFFGTIALLSLYTWLSRTKEHKQSAWIILCASGGLLMYTPGLFVWMVAGFIICRRPILASIKSVPAWAIFFGLLCLFANFASLVLASIKHHAIARDLLLIPNNSLDVFSTLKHTAWMFGALFVKAGHTDPLIVQRLPTLSILTIALVVFGFYAMLGAARAKAMWLALGIVYAIFMAGLSNNVESLALGLPQLILFGAAGLRYLYIEWRSVFPRNPVPKTFALVLIALVVLSQLYFGLRYSLSAWPSTPATRAAYVLK